MLNRWTCLLTTGVIVAATSICLSTSVSAQQRGNWTMLRPGVYTTPEISKRCQSYVRGKVNRDADSVGTTMFIACVQYLAKRAGGPVN